MDIKERVIPKISANYLIQESLSRYLFFKRLIKKHKIILDVGCGVGNGTNTLFEKGKKIYGLDIDKDAIEYANNKYSKNIIFNLGKAEKLPYKSECFDSVCCFETIEHVKSPKLLLKEIRRVIKNKGIFVISTPNKKVYNIIKTDNPYHLREYTRRGFENILNKYFTNVTMYCQYKSKRSIYTFNRFLDSQDVRQNIVDYDFLNVRKLFPQIIKEKIWTYLGMLFGRGAQNILTSDDFPIRICDVKEGQYLIAVCVKSQY